MSKRLYLMLAIMTGLLAAGCGTASLDAGYRNDDAGMTSEGEPASLFEMQFGASGREVTKNIPADAAQGVQRAVKSVRPSTATETVPE